METIYYSIHARRITAYSEAEGEKASGGQGMVCCAYVPTPRRGKTASSGGKILDFTSYRPAVEPDPETQSGPIPEEGAQRPGPRLWPLLDICASAAVIAVALGVLIRFFTL